LITVVSGLPRSGTSMMMQMLAAGGMPVLTDGLRAADEDNPRGYFEYEPVKRTRRQPAWVSRAEGLAVKIVYALLRDLPAGHDYQVIMMHRDLAETIASQREMLRRSGRTGAEVSDETLRGLFDKELREVAAWLAAQPNFRVLDVEYTECVRDPARAAARVNRFLGGTLDEASMISAVDPLLYRRRPGPVAVSRG
jgi:uncharacterized protein YcaQ